jgi:hypothetical protein
MPLEWCDRWKFQSIYGKKGINPITVAPPMMQEDHSDELFPDPADINHGVPAVY